MRRRPAGRAVILLILLAGSAPGLRAQALKPFFFEETPQRARFAQALTGSACGMIRGEARKDGDQHDLVIEGWSLLTAIPKAPLVVFGRKGQVATTTETRFRFHCRTLPHGDLVRADGTFAVTRKQWLREPLLESFVKAAAALDDAIRKKDGYRADKTLFESFDLALGCGDQQTTLEWRFDRNELSGPFEERWSVHSAVGFDQKALAEERRSLVIRLLPRAGAAPARLEAHPDEDQRVQPFPSQPLPRGKDLAGRFPPWWAELPSGFEVAPKGTGVAYALAGAVKLASFAAVRGSGVALRAPAAWAGEVAPLALDPDEIAFLDALLRFEVPELEAAR